MNLEITSYNFGERPAVTIPDPKFYEVMGEERMRAMVSDHYNLLRKSGIKHLFPEDDETFELAKKKSADFMIQICGGPDYFNQTRGKPKMINRHAPFEINSDGRNIWLTSYRKVLMQLPIPEELIISFWDYLNVFSTWMVNTPLSASQANTTE